MHWFARKKSPDQPVTGLILPGGGARNAYQAGVLKAITEILPENTANPFPVICGTSAGALNAALLASNAHQFRAGVQHLTGIWQHFHVDQVFRADPMTALKSGLRWTLAVMSGGLGRANPLSLLDNAPLRELLETHVRLARIQHAIDRGALRALGITTSGYSTGRSVTFYQGVEGLRPWERNRRVGLSEEISIDHLMASTAIPVVFPAVKLHNEYHGDGSMREHAPLSPALHLGANRLLIIGVRSRRSDPDLPGELPAAYPTLGQIAGYMFDTLFMDALDSDIERLNRINHTLTETRDQRVEFRDTALRPIEFLVISPSGDIGELVEHHAHTFPRAFRVLLHGLGALSRESRPLLSYLLFEAGFCRALMGMGYHDALRQRDDIFRLLGNSTIAF